MKDKDEGGDVSGDKYNSEIVQISKQGSWKKNIRLQYFKLQRCSYMSYTVFTQVYFIVFFTTIRIQRSTCDQTWKWIIVL